MARNDATTMHIKLKYNCPDCGHMHADGIYCHVFAEGAAPSEEAGLDDDLGENNEDGEDDDDDDDDDDDEDDVLGEKEKKIGKKDEKGGPLSTPQYIQDMGYLRCNCTTGVPSRSKRFHPCPRRQICGSIVVNTWDKHQEVIITKALSGEDRSKLEEDKFTREGRKLYEALPLIHRFLPLGQISPATVASQHWRDGTLAYRPYIDMRDAVPWNVIRPHLSQVDSIALHGRRLFTGGDKRIMASNIDTGEVQHMISRDAGEIPILYQKDGLLMSGSSNGSIRLFSIPHRIEDAALLKTVWEHTRSIRGVIMGPESVGTCRKHGIESHVCDFYSCSEDRSLKIWDAASIRPILNIDTSIIRHFAYLCISQTERHLFTGTSNATIFIFSKYDYCERDDIHACSEAGTDATGCLQVTLRMPSVDAPSGNPAGVMAVHCCGPEHTYRDLYAGSSTGQLAVWEVPESGLAFKPLLVMQAHKGSINAISSTRLHLITAGDDGCMLFIALTTKLRVRTLDVTHWAPNSLVERLDVGRKLKCIAVQEDFTHGGTIVCGTSYGDVYVCGIGTTL
jgi:WD40 repeat protein